MQIESQRPLRAEDDVLDVLLEQRTQQGLGNDETAPNAAANIPASLKRRFEVRSSGQRPPLRARAHAASPDMRSLSVPYACADSGLCRFGSSRNRT
jgi:hypothetical protein